MPIRIVRKPQPLESDHQDRRDPPDPKILENGIDQFFPIALRSPEGNQKPQIREWDFQGSEQTGQKKRKRGDYGSKLKTAAVGYLKSLLMGVRHRGGIWMSHSIPSKAMHEFSLSLFDGKRKEDELGTLAKSQEAYKEHVLEDLTWGRDFSDSLVQTFKQKVKAKYLVIGHEPMEKGFGRPHKDILILDSTTENGTYLTLVPVQGIDFFIPGQTEWEPGKGYFVAWTPTAEDLQVLADWAENGKLQPVIDSVYTLEEIREAHLRSQTERSVGKIVVKVHD